VQETILIVHQDPAYVEAMVPRLSDLGFHVLSPASTAAMALAIVAQTPATLALVGETLAGRRDGRTLARILRETWGVQSLILRERATASLPGEAWS
jgi:DNA-binding response OmpR family regulator